jgi:hypothetical protein
MMLPFSLLPPWVIRVGWPCSDCLPGALLGAFGPGR